MSKWSEFLRVQMEEKSWSAARLATEIGVTGSSVSRWMTQDVRPTPDRVQAAAEALGVSVAEAMLAAEIISVEELGVTRVAPDPDLLSDEEILRQVEKRMRRNVDAPNVVVTRNPGSDLPAWKASASRSSDRHTSRR